MNENGAKSILANPLPIVMVVLLAAGVLVKTVPLKSARPTEPERVKSTPRALQDVEARLWQDPLAAVDRVRRAAGEKAGLWTGRDGVPPFHIAGDEKRLRDLAADVRKRHGRRDHVTLLGVSVFGGSYTQDAESRRRMRFAVVSALGFHGYLPDDPGAIGYFWPTRGDPQLTVPYEWFERRDDPRADVLVLWLSEEKLNTLEKLRDLFNDLAPPDVRDGRLSLRMVGPAGSRVLIRMVRQDAAGVAPAGPRLEPQLQMFASSPTVASCDLFKFARRDCPVDRGERTIMRLGVGSDFPVAIVRTTGTDDVLANALLWELAQRGVNSQVVDGMCSEGLVLINEWDTDYSRVLLRYLADRISARCQPGSLVEGDRGDRPFDRAARPRNVRTFTYLRGLDGALPDLDKSADGASAGEDRDKSKSLSAQLEDAPLEHAEGRNQFDYLRRLGDEIARLDRDRGFARNGVRAIGIVGSDVYDKLLILQALHGRFKDKIFFTTDLDARYLHADQKDWTRNLLVASNFGLSLRPALQQSTLPFRDTYQTATYLATLMALSHLPVDTWREKMRQWLRPHLFEIGRTEAVYLASPSGEALGAWLRGEHPEGIARPAAGVPCSVELASCENIDPDWPSRHPSWRTVAMLLGMGVLAVGLIVLASRRVQALIRVALHPPDPPTRALVRAVTVGLAALVLVVASVVVTVGRAFDASLNAGVAEPFVWLEGVSVWPSLVLRFAGLVTTIVLAAGFAISLRRQADLIAGRFTLGMPRRWRLRRHWWSAAWMGPHLDLASFDSGGSPRPEADPVPPAGVEVDALWQNYLRVTAPRAMAAWIALSTGLVLGLGILAFQLLGRPAFPHRGRLVETVHVVLVIATTGTLWLVIFWVGYQTRAGARFIQTLSNVRSVWPNALLEREERDTGVPRACLADYLDFQLIAAASRRIHGLIYLPFVSIMFPVVARSELFDAMDFPPALLLITGLALAYALYTAVLLRRSAEAARTRVLEHYAERLLAAAAPDSAASPPPWASAEQIRLLVERIRGTREGAFARFAEQPAVQALLLPFGGYGGAQLIEYLINLQV